MNIRMNLQKKKYICPNWLTNNSYDDRKQITQPSTNTAKPKFNKIYSKSKPKMSNSFEYLSELGITVDLLYIVQVCKATLQNLNEEKKFES